MHNNDFDLVLRSVHWTVKLQISKIHINAQNIKCYLYNARLVFAFWYKLYIAQNLQLCFGYLSP